MPQANAGERLATALFYGAVLLLAYLVFRIFEPFLVPLGWAAVLVVFFHPLHARLDKRLGKTSAAAASTLGVTLILIVPALLLITLSIRQGWEAAVGIQHAVAAGRLPWVTRAWAWIVERAPGEAPADLATLVRQGAERVAGFLAAEAGTLLRNTVVFLFEFFVMVFALFYFFRDADGIMVWMRRVLPFEESHRDRMITEARNLIFASVTTSLIVAAVQGLVGGLAFALVGLGAAVFWGLAMAFFSFLPVVGAWGIWAPAAVWLMATGRWGRGLMLVGISVVVTASVDNFLRPMLISGRARLSGLLIFIGVLGGVAVFGMLGVVLGPIIVATAAGILDTYARDPKTGRRETGNPGNRAGVGRGHSAVLE